jgi:hypothetical protein
MIVIDVSQQRKIGIKDLGLRIKDLGLKIKDLG